MLASEENLMKVRKNQWLLILPSLVEPYTKAHTMGSGVQTPSQGYPLKAGQLTYDCRYSTMHGMPVTSGRGFRGLKPLWYNSVPP